MGCLMCSSLKVTNSVVWQAVRVSYDHYDSAIGEISGRFLLHSVICDTVSELLKKSMNGKITDKIG
jgi:hypothetical protein